MKTLFCLLLLLSLPAASYAQNTRADYSNLKQILLRLPDNSPRIVGIANRMIRLLPTTSPSVLVLANRRINSITRVNQLLALTINTLANTNFPSLELKEGKIIQSIEAIAYSASRNQKLLRLTGLSSQELYLQIINSATVLVNSIPNVPNPEVIITTISGRNTTPSPSPTPVPYGA